MGNPSATVIFFDIIDQKKKARCLYLSYNLLSQNLNGALSGLRQFLAAESPLKMMKNAFISPQKLFSFSRYLKFCLDFLVI